MSADFPPELYWGNDEDEKNAGKVVIIFDKNITSLKEKTSKKYGDVKKDISQQNISSS